MVHWSGGTVPSLKTYRLFISHAWDYGHYDRLVEMLNEAPNFYWEDYSIPEDDPLHSGSASALREGIKRHIRPTSCVVAIAAMNVPYRDWIKMEIEFSAAIGKPIIGIRPHGNVQEPLIIQANALEIVGWRTGSIVSAIRRYSR